MLTAPSLSLSASIPRFADHPFVDSRFYTTVNMIHTMESLIGLPPMNQNDAYAAGDGPTVFRPRQSAGYSPPTGATAITA